MLHNVTVFQVGLHVLVCARVQCVAIYVVQFSVNACREPRLHSVLQYRWTAGNEVRPVRKFRFDYFVFQTVVLERASVQCSRSEQCQTWNCTSRRHDCI